jgi:hypothetical protein
MFSEIIVFIAFRCMMFCPASQHDYGLAAPVESHVPVHGALSRREAAAPSKASQSASNLSAARVAARRVSLA